jgi:hypothetical protein
MTIIGRDLEHIHEPKIFTLSHSRNPRIAHTNDSLQSGAYANANACEFQLSSSLMMALGWVNGEEALMDMLHFMAFPTRQID